MRKLVGFQNAGVVRGTLAYFDHVHGTQNIGAENLLHILAGGVQQGGIDHNPCVVNQQVEPLAPHQGASLLGALFYARKVGGI